MNKDLERLRGELEKRKVEVEMEKAVWKLVLNNSKTAIGNYAKLNKEIAINESITEALLNVADSNSEEWRALYEIKMNDIEELHKYKFLVAALLEHCSQDLDKDIDGLKFGHEESTAKMNRVLDKPNNFDLNDYLTNAYRTNKLMGSYDVHSELIDSQRNDEYASKSNTKGYQSELINAFKFPLSKPIDKPNPPLSNPTDLENALKEEAPETNVPLKSNHVEPENTNEEPEDIKKLMEEKDIRRLKKHLNKLKKDLVFAPKKIISEKKISRESSVESEKPVEIKKPVVVPKTDKNKPVKVQPKKPEPIQKIKPNPKAIISSK